MQTPPVLGVSRKHALRGRSHFSAAKARRKGEKMEKTGVKKKAESHPTQRTTGNGQKSNPTKVN